MRFRERLSRGAWSFCSTHFESDVLELDHARLCAPTVLLAVIQLQLELIVDGVFSLETQTLEMPISVKSKMRRPHAVMQADRIKTAARGKSAAHLVHNGCPEAIERVEVTLASQRRQVDGVNYLPLKW